MSNQDANEGESKMTYCNVPKPIFFLETLTIHCLLLFGCVLLGLLMKLRIRVYIMDIIEMK